MNRNGQISNENNHVESLREERLAKIIAEFADRVNAGEAIDAQDILIAHPDLAHDLAPALDALDALKPSAIEEPLGTFGDYTLRRRIGRGGMGVVYDAWEKSMNRQVALKVLPAGVAADNKSFARFVREAQVSGNLHHPNVVPVYGMGVKERTPYYAMEYVEGETLGQILSQRGNVPGTDSMERVRTQIISLLCRNKMASEATVSGMGRTIGDSAERPSVETDDSRVAYCTRLAAAFANVADGLEHAHSKGVIHRDIKPSNLMLDYAGRLRILDFGLARLEGQDALTMTGDFLGTPLYMSPEQARRRKIAVDHRTDVYSLGATMYEMFVFQPPFRGDDPHDTLTRIIESDPQSLREFDAAIPRELETIVLKCLRKEPGDRYETAAALAQDLRRFVRGEAIEARPQPAWEKLSRRLWRSKMRITVTATILAFLSIVSYLLPTPWPSATRLLWQAESRDAGFQGEVSRDGRYLTYADWTTGNLAVRDLIEGKSRKLTSDGSWTAPVGYADGSAWSPDGQEIAYTWYDGAEDIFQLRTVKVSDLTPRILCRNQEYIRPGDWSSDGESIFAVIMRTDKTPEIVQVSRADGSRRVLKSVTGRWPGPLRLSPDDRYVAYSVPPIKTHLSMMFSCWLPMASRKGMLSSIRRMTIFLAGCPMGNGSSLPAIGGVASTCGHWRWSRAMPRGPRGWSKQVSAIASRLAFQTRPRFTTARGPE